MLGERLVRRTAHERRYRKEARAVSKEVYKGRHEKRKRGRKLDVLALGGAAVAGGPVGMTIGAMVAVREIKRQFKRRKEVRGIERAMQNAA